MALTSVIITTHNRPQLLARAVASAAQAGTNVEIIVVDDASTDETSSVCSGLAGIKYVRVDRNQRVAGARNLGLLASSGDYVTFLDDDDRRLPNSLDRQLKRLAADEQAGLIYGQAICVDQSGNPTAQTYPRVCPQGDVFWELMGQNFIPCGSVLFRRSCLNQVGLLDQSLAGLDDWDLWIRIAELFPVIALAEPVLQWRQSTPGSDQGTSGASAIATRSLKQFRECWRHLPRAAAASAKTRRKAWRQLSTNVGAHLAWEVPRSLFHGNVIQAIRNLFALLRLGPLTIFRLVQDRGIRRFRQMIGRSVKIASPSFANLSDR